MASRVGAAAALALAFAIATTARGIDAAESGVKAGYLRCSVEDNVSFMFGSTRDVTCT
jgi:hypothetical protein